MADLQDFNSITRELLSIDYFYTFKIIKPYYENLVKLNSKQGRAKNTKFSPIVSYITYKLIVCCGPCPYYGAYCVAGFVLIIQTFMNGLILIYLDTKPKVIYIIIELYIYFCTI